MSTFALLRKQFPLVMVGLVVAVSGMLLIRQKFFASSNEVFVPPVAPLPSAPLAPIDPVELREAWETQVKAVLQDYDANADARSAKERLLLVRVPATGRDAHLALYLAFTALAESRPEGKGKLTEARTLFLNADNALRAATSTR